MSARYIFLNFYKSFDYIFYNYCPILSIREIFIVNSNKIIQSIISLDFTFSFWQIDKNFDSPSKKFSNLLSMYCCCCGCWPVVVLLLFIVVFLLWSGTGNVSPCCWKNSLKSGMHTDSYKLDGTFSRLGCSSPFSTSKTKESIFLRKKLKREMEEVKEILLKKYLPQNPFWYINHANKF